MSTVARFAPSVSFVPPRLVRHGYVQTALATMKTRRLILAGRRAHPPSTPVVLDCGDGVRLLALHDPPRGDRGTVVLLHGWEGSATSTYLESIRPGLLADGFEVYRLNFRDHGPTHGLNRGLFHSCRTAEVVGAVQRIAERCTRRPLCLVGYSLGGNFALRVGLRAPGRGFVVDRILAINPVLDPARVLDALERGPRIFERHFVRKWRRSIRAKRKAFPGVYDLDDWMRIESLREQTRRLIVPFTEFGSLEAYLDGYCIARDRLAGLTVRATLITAWDDPIIPVADFDELSPAPATDVRIERFGGHCGFVADLRLRAWIDRWVRRQLDKFSYS